MVWEGSVTANSAWQLSAQPPDSFPCWRGPGDAQIPLHQLLVPLLGWQAQHLGGKCHPRALLGAEEGQQSSGLFLGILSLKSCSGGDFLL